jgi:hypothetical protein
MKYLLQIYPAVDEFERLSEPSRGSVAIPSSF